MTIKPELLQDWKLRTAVVLTRTLPDGRTQYRVSPHAITRDGQVPPGGFLSNWCSTEERAWHAAVCRRSHQVYSSDFGEGY